MLKRKTDIKKQGEMIREVRQATVAPTSDDYARSIEYRSLNKEKLHVVSFFLHEDKYAFEVNDAVEVLKCKDLTAVPRTPDFIKGVLSVRGDMVPVIDLRMRLGICPSENRSGGRILITTVEDLKVGFIVDRLSGVEEVSMNSITPPNIEDGPARSQFVKGVIWADGRAISLLNLSMLIDITGIK